MGKDGSQLLTVESIEQHTPVLIEAAEKLRDLVKSLNGAEEIRGFLVYSEAAKEPSKDEPAEEELVSEQTQAIVKKFKGKLLMEFLPQFLLEQYQDASYLLYESFD